MADQNTRTVTIAFKGETSEVRQQMGALERDLQTLGATVTKITEKPYVIKTDKGELESLKSSMTVLKGVAAESKDVLSLIDRINKAAVAMSARISSDTVRNVRTTSAAKIPDIAQIQRNADVAAFRLGSSFANANAQANAASSVYGPDSPIAINKALAAKVALIEKRKAETVLGIEKDLQNGKINLQEATTARSIAVANAENAKAIAQTKANAALQLIADKDAADKRLKNKAENDARWLQSVKDESARMEARAKREAEATLRRVKQEQAELLAEKERIYRAQISKMTNLQQSMDMAAATRQAQWQYGINSPQARIAQEKQNQFSVRQQMDTQLRAIHNDVASGRATPDEANVRTASVLASGYDRLNKSTQELVAAQKDLKASQNSVSSGFKNMVKHIAEIYVLYQGLNTVFGLVGSALRSVPHAGIAMEGTVATLQAVTGTVAYAYKELHFLNQEAIRTGIPIQELRESYKSFAASALLAGESVETTNRIFKNTNTIATTLHMSREEVEGTFLALSQAFNKGKLQAEELVKQLAQRLPGIYNQTARALGMSTSQLSENMKKGLIEAHGSLDKTMGLMAGTFSKGFDSASNGLNANIGRLQTNWTLFAENMYRASSEMLIKVLQFTTGAVGGLKDMSANTGEVQRATSNLVSVLAGAISGYGAAKLGVMAYTGAVSLLRLETLSAMTGTTLLGRAMMGLNATLKANLFTGVAIGVGVAVAKFFELKERAEDLQAAIDAIKEKSNAKASGSSAEYDAFTNPEVQRKYDIVKQQKDRVDRLQNLANTFVTLPTTKLGIQQRETIAKAKADLRIAWDDFNEFYQKTLDDTEKSLNETYQPVQADLSKRYEMIHIQLLNATGREAEAAKDKIIKEYEDILPQMEKAAKAGDAAAQKALNEYQSLLDNAGNKAEASTANKFAAQTVSIYKDQKAAIDKEAAEAKAAIQRKQKLLELHQGEASTRISNADYIQQEVVLSNELLRIEQERIDAQLKLQKGAQEKLELTTRTYKVEQSSMEALYAGIKQVESSGGRNNYNASGGGLGARGPMQIRSAAWQDATGKSVDEFLKASNAELEAAGKAYFDKMLSTYRNPHIALAAYNQGGGVVNAAYKKAGVAIGSTDQESLAKVKGNLNPAANKYINSVVSSMEKMGLLSKAQLAVELQQNDVEQLIGDKVRAQEESAARLETLQQKKLENEKAYKQLLEELEYKALESQGQLERATEIRQQREFEGKQKLLQSELDSGNRSAAKGLRDLSVIKIMSQLDSTISRQEGLRAKANQAYNESIQRTNSLKQLGVISEMTGLRNVSAANEAHILQLEEIQRLEEEALATAQSKAKELSGSALTENISVQEKLQEQIANSRAELENLKNDSDAVASHFVAVFNNAFDSAFVGLVTGSQTAKQAFSSFANSVLQDIAKIVASELRSQLLGLAFGTDSSGKNLGVSAGIKAGAGIIGGIIGSFFGGGAGVGAAIDNALLPSLAANGKAFDASSNVIPFARGGIVTRPTNFRFAKGVGLMGEAGPEAIIPLSRGRDGKLGISGGTAVANTSHQVNNIQLTVQQVPGESSAQMGENITKAMVIALARNEIKNQARPGNILNRITKVGG